MCYLDCSQSDCCHNKGGGCCLDGVSVHHTGANDSVCSSYRNNEAYGNVCTDNVPPTAETSIRCDDAGCRHNDHSRCTAMHITIKECSCGPQCATRADR